MEWLTPLSLVGKHGGEIKTALGIVGVLIAPAAGAQWQFDDFGFNVKIEPKSTKSAATKQAPLTGWDSTVKVGTK